jgi:glucose/arabinose dehydrogenase
VAERPPGSSACTGPVSGSDHAADGTGARVAKMRAVRLLPSSRPLRIGLVVVLVLAGAAAIAFRQQIGDVYGYFFPVGIVDDATERTSGPAPTAATSPSTTTTSPSSTTEAPAPTGTDPAIVLEPVVELPGPSSVADPAGPGSVLVSTLDGRVHAVDLDTGETEVVLDLRDRVSTGGERGLLGLAIDPAGERLYLNYTNGSGDTEIRSVAMDRGRPRGGIDASVLHLEIGQPYRNHNGGNLVFGPDGLLWIGVGDGGSANDPAGVAQDPDVVLGKMLRVVPDPAGGVSAPTSNPTWGDRPEVWAIGLRNPWRYSFDRATGLLWVADVGQNAIEEVTVVDPAADRVNFGWDRLEGSRPLDGEDGPELTGPTFEYTHDEGCSITGGYVYRGDEIASLQGWYLFGDFCGGWIRAVPADDPAADPVELVAGYGAVLSFAELESGELLVLGQEGVSAVVGA